MTSDLRKSCIVANWKMQGSFKTIAQLLTDIAKGLTTSANTEIVICPPAVYLQKVQTILSKNPALKPIRLGAQNVYCESKGAFTGEVSAEMLMDLGCQYVIIGHSERRTLFFEDDTLIARKFVASYHAGLIPIICIGETEAERTQGKTVEVIYRQLEAILQHGSIEMLAAGIIAYEPVWAIGTGLTASIEQIEVVHTAIRSWLTNKNLLDAHKTRIVYGGSVNGQNAERLMASDTIDGALVGGASLIANDFLTICSSVIARV